MASGPKCWCGNLALTPFSDDYLRCERCETLVLRKFPTTDPGIVSDDELDLYGKDYFSKHLPKNYGYPGIKARVRSDLPERNLFWLEALLRFSPPEGKLLELGCFHGGFVALAKLAGYDATGLELSPTISRQARKLFGIDVFEGPIEAQTFPQSGLSVIAHFDVLEHLWNPLATMKRCNQLLRKDGVMLVQTPRYPETSTFEELRVQKDPFLAQLKPKEHLYLFSQSSMKRLLAAAGFASPSFEPAIFAHYDMFFATSPSGLAPVPQNRRNKLLERTPSGRVVLAMLDLEQERRNQRDRAMDTAKESASLGAQLANLRKDFENVEKDRAVRGKVIEDQGAKFSKLEAEFDKRLKELNQVYETAEALKNERDLLKAQFADLERNFKAAEKDRVHRGKVIEDQGANLSKLEAEFDKRLKELNRLYETAEALKNERDLLKAQFADLERNFKAVEKDRIHRGEVIEEQGAQLSKLGAEFEKRLKELNALYARTEALKNERNLLKAELAEMRKNLDNVEKERALRGKVIEDQGAKLSNLEAEFDKRLKELNRVYETAEALKNERDLVKTQFADLERNFKAAEKDRVHRAKVIEDQGAQLSNLEAEFDRRLAELHQVYSTLETLKNERNMLGARLDDLMRNFQNVERDREVRGRVIEDQGKALQESQRLVHLVEVDRDAWKGFHQKQEEMLAKLAAEIEELRLARVTADQERDNWMSSALASQERATRAEAALHALEEKWWARAARMLGID